MTLRRAIRGAIKSLLALVTLSIVGLCLVTAPSLLFPYQRTVGVVTFEDSKPIPLEADLVLAEIDGALARGPFKVDVPLTLYVADGWRGQFYFARARRAGGVVYFPLSRRHAFLSGADYRANRLLKDGEPIDPPKTLAYYGIHELVHVLTGRAVGWERFAKMPFWVREGLADYVALGAQGLPALLPADRDGQHGIAVMARAEGSYPHQRALVAWALERGGWTMSDLLNTDLDEWQMRALIRRHRSGE